MRSIMVALSMLAGTTWGLAVWASPTGLNNIPTADIVPRDLLVLQAWVACDGDASWFTGLKFSPAERWEAGADDTVAGEGSAGAATLQAKYRILVGEKAACALGVANLSDDRER